MIINIDIKPLSVNRCWQGRRFKTKEYNQYIKDVTYIISGMQQLVRPVDYLCQIHYRFYLKNWKMTDGDNLVKGLQDILVKVGLLKDDRFIMKYVIEKIPSQFDSIEIELEALK